MPRSSGRRRPSSRRQRDARRGDAQGIGWTEPRRAHGTPPTACPSLAAHVMVSGPVDALKPRIAAAVDRLADELEALSHRIHDHPELAFKEERSEEHTSELQSHSDLVCRLLLEKKKKKNTKQKPNTITRHTELNN